MKSRGALSNAQIESFSRSYNVQQLVAASLTTGSERAGCDEAFDVVSAG
jgi:hypothetical protein